MKTKYLRYFSLVLITTTFISTYNNSPVFAQKQYSNWVEAYHNDSGDRYLVNINITVYPKKQFKVMTLTQYAKPQNEGEVTRLSTFRFDCLKNLFAIEKTTTFDSNSQIVLNTDDTVKIEWSAITPNSLGIAISDSFCPLLKN